MASFDATAEPEGFDLKVEVPGGLISTLASTCASNFYNALQLLSEDEDKKYEGIFRQFEKRFLDWAAYLGVFAGGNGSLDHRLENHPQYRDLVLLVLDMLNVSLVQTTTEPSEPSSDESSDDEVDRRKIEAESIQKSINELDRLVIHIRQSSTSSLDARVKAFGARKPSEVSSYEARATLAVNGLYPEASHNLRRHLSKSMTQRYTKLLYWQSHDKKLRADCRRDKQRRDDSNQPQREPSPLPTKASSLPRQPARDEDPAPPKPGASRAGVGTSVLSGTQASELGFRITIPPAEAKMPARKRAGASTVLETGAKFPSPPRFEDGEDRKPCPLCRKIFLKDDFTDNKWWRSHVNDDLIPFVCVSSTCMGSPTFAGRTAWKGHIGQYHDGMWLQRLKVDSQKSSDTVRGMDTCPLCCLPLAELTNLKASIPQASESETSPPKARTPGNKRASKTVRFDVSEPETLVTADTETPTRAKSAMMLDHIADHLQFLALLTPRLSTEKLGEGGTHTFSSDQGLSSDQGSGKRSTLDDDFASAEGDETQDADMNAPLDEAPQTEATTDQAWQEDEEIESGEAMDWSIVATLNPSNEGDDKIEHMQRVRAECNNLLEAALESSVEGRHYRRLFLETAATSCKSITTEMLTAVEREVAVGALIDFFVREIPRDALHGFFKKTLTSVDSGKDFMLVDYCTEQVWDFRPYQDSHVPTDERFASRRVLFGLLAMLDRPLDILRAIKDRISDLSIPLATVTLTQLFPTWTGTEVSSFMRFQRDVCARVLEGSDLRHFMDSSQPGLDPADTQQQDQDGVEVLHDCPDATVDICFVHGLTGNRISTWTAHGQTAPWPKTLLPEKLSKARILTYGYDAYIVSKAVASSNRLIDHAMNLLIDLIIERAGSRASSRPLVFVAHSLGGLVCKEAIL
ncbi:hypothetical protein LCI18_007850 [Fusarium solani-melongenae]|uniref:Uncharacterized protein n=1 Tax=Fusarium solani subsp. cucurbitae TaxID=2747967 RepID=A0ACD3Z6S3_FUSSC|nr:hypothetical protein LCI18_007850 [Fusarium solani-melongenae]